MRMIGKIPEGLLNLYGDDDWILSLYLRLRWRLCPFEKIEQLLPKSGRLLDLGCGYGILSNYMALKSRTREVIGIDRSVKRITVAAGSSSEKGNPAFIRCDITELESGLVDGIVLTDFLHHIDYQNQASLLSRCRELLKEDGVLVILEVDNRPLIKYIITLLIDKILNVPDKIYYRDNGTFTKVLREAGFAVTSYAADEGLPLSDRIYVCTRKERA